MYLICKYYEAILNGESHFSARVKGSNVGNLPESKVLMSEICPSQRF